MRRAAVLLAALAPAAHADEPGRLFHTPEQRAAIEREHRRDTEERSSDVLILNGIVQRSDGTRTFWIGGATRHSDSNGQPADSQSFPVAGRPRTVAIKVGQRLPPAEERP